jgi:type III secretion system YscQ/HrcQ family protein
MAVRDYPWTALARVPKRAVRTLNAARARLSRAFAPERLGAALSELVGANIEVGLGELELGPPAARLSEVTLEADGNRVTIGAEPALVLELIERVLARPFTLKHANTELEPALAGAFAALALEAARRVATLPPTLESRPVDGDGALCVSARVRVDGRPYSGYALVQAEHEPTRGREPVGLEVLGSTVLSVPLVVGLSLVTRAELRRLAVGSAFVPGEGLFIDRAGNGLGALAAATSERGVRVELSLAQGIVLRDETLALAPDVESSGDSMDEANDMNETLTDAVLEAPVVVRIELGAVSMTAGEWARLRPNDVIETGRRIAEPVVLRVGGRVVARGELVDVEGELGVRVRELVGAPET